MQAQTSRKQEVEIQVLLCGGEGGIPAAQYARHVRDFLRPSRPFSASPHVQFLQQFQAIGQSIFTPDVFRATPYYRNAVQCLRLTDHYFSCRKEDHIVMVARGFVDRFLNKPVSRAITGSGYSLPGAPVLVRPIAYSQCYEILDGHHRLAIAYVRGSRSFPVRIEGSPVLTPLQQLVLDHRGIHGRKELCQPIDSPELKEGWRLVRRCNDRLALMHEFLAQHDLLPPPHRSYIDIACSYGWFVRAFQDFGFRVYGVERDWAACEIAQRVFGLDRNQVAHSEAVHFLQSNKDAYDVVSCFSLLHHFAMGLTSISAEEMLRLLDDRTRAVLFLEMGQCHEEWFQEKLAGWDTDFIEQWIKDHSSFKVIHRLGTDSDNVPPFERNYRRTLFACMR